MKRCHGAGGRKSGWKVAVALAVSCCALLLAAGCDSLQQVAENALSAGTSPQTAPSVSSTGTGSLMLGVMVHVEGYQNEARDRQAFARHAGLVRQYAAVFEKYGLPMTIEVGPEFVSGCSRWGDNVLAELAGKGHAIGVHADVGAEPGLTQDLFVTRLAEMKRDAEALGVEVRHVSGVCSSLDWVKAVEDAGFAFVTGTVEYALKSIPADRLPAEYHGVLSAKTPSQCHGNVPYELSDRLHPWRMASGADWLRDDPAGRVVIIPGDGGTNITRMAEDASGNARGKAPFDQADIDAFKQEVDRSLALCVSDKVNALYVGWSVGQQVDPAVVEAWAQAIKACGDTGTISWKTIPAMYDAYVAWEGGAR